MADLARERLVDVPLDPPGQAQPAVNRQAEAPFWRSIRFRLTAWYALVMFLIILLISLALHTLLERTLEQDAQQRLVTTGEAIANGTIVEIIEVQGPMTDGNPRLTVDINPPDEADLVLSGLWFQYYDMRRQPFVSDSGPQSGALQSYLQEALVGLDVFRDDRAVMKTLSIGDEESLVLIFPLTLQYDNRQLSTQTPGWLVVGEPLGAREKLIDLADQSLLLFGIAGVLLASWGGWLIAGRALLPVERIAESANSIAVGAGGMNFSRRVEVPETGDELFRLAVTFNAMLDRVEAAFRTQQRFVADASHELRSPLTAVRGNVDVMLRQLASGRPVDLADFVEDLRIVQRESHRMGRLIEDLLTLARTDVASLGDLLKPEEVELDLLAREALQIARQLATGQELRLRADTPVTLVADKDRLVQVMIILLENAIRHTPEGGIISLTIDRAIDPETREACARICVADTGAGIAAEHVPHLFERFYRAERARSRQLGGTGLGLSIALAVTRAHAGWIDVDSEPGQGTTFTVWLPLANVFTGREIDVDPSLKVRRPLRWRRPGRPKPRPPIEPRVAHPHHRSLPMGRTGSDDESTGA